MIAMNVLQRVRTSPFHTHALPVTALLLMVFLMLIAPEALSQRLPNVLPDGVSTTGNDPAEIIVSVFKVVVSLVLWLAVLGLAVKTIIEAIKDIKEAKDGDSKWISAGKSIAGGVFFFLVVLALALWIQGAFLS